MREYLDKILFWAGGAELLLGGVMQAYPELVPLDIGFYVGWFIIALGILTLVAGFFVKSKKDMALTNYSKKIFDQSVKVGGSNNTVSPS